jgi:putative addiction module component (TIGR02574 family)
MLNIQELLELPADERIQLANELWDSVEQEVKASELTPAQIEELERRLADAKANPDDDLSWEEVKASLRARRA